MNIYNEWGFKESPFKTTSLPANEFGEGLLVGRDSEIKLLLRRIYNPPKICTVEGLNGIGKTSLVNVTGFKALKKHLETGEGSLYIPCRKVFQVSKEQPIDDFIDEVLMEVAQTLIEKATELKKRGVKLKTTAVDKWLNSPQIETYQGGVWLVSAGKSAETNTSAGFERRGFRKEILSWLSQIFPNNEAGGVICTIDNLELLQSSEVARAVLEQLRDELLTVQGLRWVLCGALGIVFGVVSSPRLEGYLHAPVEVKGLNDALAKEIFKSRINAFSKNISKSYLPLMAEDFEKLYEILNQNLRSALSKADDYCQWAADKNLPKTTEEKNINFQEWLKEQSANAFSAVKSQVMPRSMKLLFNAAKAGGVFSPSDYSEYSFNSIQAMRPKVKELENAGALVSTQDDGDKRRKTIQLTPMGWLVNYYQANFENKNITR